MRRLVALLVVLVVAAACSSNEIADQGDRSRTGKQGAQAGKAGGKKGGNAGGKGAGNVKDEIDAATDPDSPGGEEAPDDFGGNDAPSSGIDPSLARASAALDDPPDDTKKQGLTPAYTELTRASIQGLGDNVRITMRFAADVPNQVTKNEYMVIAMGVTGRKKDDGIALGATADDQGWKPYAGGKDQRSKFPGTFEVQGNEIVMTIPWSFVNGPRAFEWYSSTGWYRQLGNQTHWSFDSIPNEEAAKFPG